MKKESVYQSELIKKIKNLYPNAIIIKNDAKYRQGFPDLSVFCEKGKAVFLEVKKDKNSPHQPNQDYTVDQLKELGYFASFIYPENEEEVLNDIQQTFGPN